MAHDIARHIRRDEGLSDPMRKDEAQLAIDHFLVLAHQCQKTVSIWQITYDIR